MQFRTFLAFAIFAAFIASLAEAAPAATLTPLSRPAGWLRFTADLYAKANDNNLITVRALGDIADGQGMLGDVKGLGVTAAVLEQWAKTAGPGGQFVKMAGFPLLAAGYARVGDKNRYRTCLAAALSAGKGYVGSFGINQLARAYAAAGDLKSLNTLLDAQNADTAAQGYCEAAIELAHADKPGARQLLERAERLAPQAKFLAVNTVVTEAYAAIGDTATAEAREKAGKGMDSAQGGGGSPAEQQIGRLRSLVQRQILQGRHDDAERNFRQLLKLVEALPDSSRVPWLAQLASLAAEMGDDQLSAQCVAEVGPGKPGSPYQPRQGAEDYAHGGRAIRLALAGKIDQALAEIKAISDDNGGANRSIAQIELFETIGESGKAQVGVALLAKIDDPNCRRTAVPIVARLVGQDAFDRQTTEPASAAPIDPTAWVHALPPADQIPAATAIARVILRQPAEP